MMVNEFVGKYVPMEYRKKFNQLMREWDGSFGTSWSFYDMDVLYMKLDEAKE
jgi:hypothetical protein